MKKRLCILSLLTAVILCFSSAVMAEEIAERGHADTVSFLDAFPADNDEIIAMLNDMFNDPNGYCKIWYYKPSNCICVDVAFDGMASIVQEILANDYGSDYELWRIVKDATLLMNDYILWMFESMGREDLTLALSIMNDDIYIRNDKTKSTYTTLFSVRNSEAWFDIVFEREWM